MTARAMFEREKRRIMTVAIVGFALGAVGASLAQENLLKFAPYTAALPGCIVFALAMLYAYLLAFRCPRCGVRWNLLAMGGRGLFGIDGRIRYCPFCGYALDAE